MSLNNQLDDIIRKILRLKNTQHCFVCGTNAGIYNGLQVGHYVSRQNILLRWDLKNLELVCSRCNYRHISNKTPHKDAIISKYGLSRIKYLDKKIAESKLHTKSFNRFEKLELLEKLQEVIDKSQSV